MGGSVEMLLVTLPADVFMNSFGNVLVTGSAVGDRKKFIGIKLN